MKPSEDQIKKALSSFGIPFESIQTSITNQYLSQVLQWNTKFNLISKNDEPNVLYRHFLDSLAPLKFPLFKPHASVLDLGSGAGFPAIPIKIMRPDLIITAVESTSKKADFLKQIVIELNLIGFRVINTRLTCDNPPMRHTDYVVTRAVCDLRRFAKICGHRVKSSGMLIAYKNEKTLPHELRRFNSSNLSSRYSVDRVLEYDLPNMASDFCLVCITKKG